VVELHGDGRPVSVWLDRPHLAEADAGDPNLVALPERRTIDGDHGANGPAFSEREPADRGPGQHDECEAYSGGHKAERQRVPLEAPGRR